MPFQRLSLAVCQPHYPPWDWQLDEPHRAFARFRVYRDLPTWARSTAVVAHRVGASRSSIEKQATAYRWVERARDWDHERRLQRLGYPPWEDRMLQRARAVRALIDRHAS